MTVLHTWISPRVNSGRNLSQNEDRVMVEEYFCDWTSVINGVLQKSASGTLFMMTHTDNLD